MVRVYRSDDRWRVVVDGLAHFDVAAPEEAEPKARQVILERLRAYLPDRRPPPPEAAMETCQLYDLILVRVDGSGAPPAGTDAVTSGGRRSEVTPRPTKDRVTGRHL